jgi:predicted nucleotidyltransferase
MRLTNSEIQIIKDTLSAHSESSSIYLHGSRVDDCAKGGDIDLFFIVEDSVFNKLNKIYIQAELSRKLNEQRVDLLIISNSELESNEFYLNSVKQVL